MAKFSIIICCYNSALRIIPTLAALERIELPENCVAELLLVDNNCTDSTVVMARRYWSRVDVPLVIVHEAKAGLSHARAAGFKHASGEFFVLVDDDNSLSPTYLSEVYKVFLCDARVGIVGGFSGLPAYYVFPEELSDYWVSYALSPVGQESGEVASVFGAGMVLRREVIEDLHDIGFVSFLTDREAESLSSGGDTELCFVTRQLGWKIHYCKEAQLEHEIPQNRFTLEYCRKLQTGIGASLPLLLFLHAFLKNKSYHRVIIYCASRVGYNLLCLLWLYITLRWKSLPALRLRAYFRSGIVCGISKFGSIRALSKRITLRNENI